MAIDRLVLRPGRRLGRYEVERPIASGGMGTVYRGRDTETGEAVAIKRMPDKRDAAPFEIEARLLSQLRHPGVARIIDHFADEDDTYTIVLELVPGTDLARRLWDHGTPGLPVLEVLERAHETCEALHYVHGQQIVHGDVKPRNMVLGTDGVVLVDFGVAVHIGEQSGVTSAGTARYMAPEVFAGDAVSPRSDVYSLGASIWNLLAGSPPVYGEDTVLCEEVPGVSRELEEVLRGALALRAEDRISSPEELARALGVPLDRRRGTSLAVSIDRPELPRKVIERLVRTAAGFFEASAASVALVEKDAGELVYVAAWGAGAREVVGLRLRVGGGIAGAVAAGGEPVAVPSCRTDPRFSAAVAAGTGYVPHTMLVMPLKHDGRTSGVLSVLDRRDGAPYTSADIPRGTLLADLAVAILA